MTLAEVDLRGLADVAATVLDEVSPYFVEHVGAPEEVVKGVADWATAADLELERRIGAALTDRTGLPVHGEEFGGVPLDQGTAWVLDPIDGTANYTARMPLTGISLGLLTDGVPVIGLIWVPLLGERYRAVVGGPVERNGVAQPPLPAGRLEDATVAVGNISPKGAHGRAARYPFGFRCALVTELAKRATRVRMLGSSAVELAWTAAGVVGGQLNFGNHPWDNAAGVLLVRCGGGAVSDLEHGPYGLHSTSIVSGRSGVVAEIGDLLDELGDPQSYA